MITKDFVVSLGYVLKNAQGEELDRADATSPLSYLHGYKQIIPGLETELEGLSVGDKKDVVIQPENAYGDVNPELRLKLSRSQFPPDMEIKPGQQFEANSGDKHQVFTVIEIEGEDVKVDGNHPLAGQVLSFSIEVLNVREATEEEKTHGHSHDGDGHHH